MLKRELCNLVILHYIYDGEAATAMISQMHSQMEDKL